MSMTMANSISLLWEWLGWKSKRISEHRIDARESLKVAEEKLQSTVERAARTESMSDWLMKRSQQNHIAEALSSVLDHPRGKRW